MGLIERVRRASSNTAVNRAIDHRNRLFGEAPAGPPIVAITSPPSQHPLKMPPMSPSGTIHMKSSIKQKQYKISRPEICFEEPISLNNQSLDESTHNTFSDADTPLTSSPLGAAKCDSPSFPSGQLLHFGFVINRPAKTSSTAAVEDTQKLSLNTELANSMSATDSGNHTKTSDICEASGSSSCEVTYNDVSLSKQSADHTSNSCCSFEGTDRELSEFACARLCTLLKSQLELAMKEIKDRYKNFKASESTQNTNVPSVPDTIIASTEPEKTVAIVATHSFDASNSVDESPPSATTASTPLPSVPSEFFVLLESSPPTHFYANTLSEPVNAAQFYRTVRFDHNLLQLSMPPGVWIRVYEDRMDLMSVMIAGPEHTPYEDGMFLFDIHLGKNYPHSPPSCHYVSFCADRLNPNLYEDGKVCVSLLGTWAGKGSEVWGPCSTLLQVIVSIQGLILVPEPYYNEAGYERQKGKRFVYWFYLVLLNSPF